MPGRRLLSETDFRVGGFGFNTPDAVQRHLILKDTLKAFMTAEPPDRYARLAQINLQRWRKACSISDSESVVTVIPGDWGEVTRSLTQRYGACFAVLNMANAYVPGGAYVEGAVAQEENMFRRTDCHFHIGDNEYDAKRDCYYPELSRLLCARDGRVYLDTQHPRVCIRGPEDRSREDLGYPWLPDDQIFPFFELRASAQDLRDGSPFDAKDARQRIAAQFDTLRQNGVRHAVLGAFGCGAFRNPTHKVAQIYKQELDKRKGDFSVITFAIFAAGYGPDNYTPFAEVFSA